ncbi:putative transposase OrfB [Thermoplasmatales archaeon]|nr:putative transposase OrfB [Thermoplasmatales archaeon]
MMAVSKLNEIISVSRISWILDAQRPTIYCWMDRKNDMKATRKPRIAGSAKSQILNLSEENTTYRNRRIWALLRNSGIHVSIKTVSRVMRRNNLSLPYARHRNRTRAKYLRKPEDMNILWETNIHYIGTYSEWMVYLMSIKDCFSKRRFSYELSRSCTA